MVHGVMASEIGETGAGIWTLSGGNVALFADAALSEGSSSSNVWARSFVREAGDAKYAWAGTPWWKDRWSQTYARFEPFDYREFIRLCHGCNARRYALVSDGTAPDAEALATLSDLGTLICELDEARMASRSAAPILQAKVTVRTGWAYAIGFCGEAPATFFLSPDAATVEAYLEACSGLDGWRMIERW